MTVFDFKSVAFFMTTQMLRQEHVSLRTRLGSLSALGTMFNAHRRGFPICVVPMLLSYSRRFSKPPPALEAAVVLPSNLLDHESHHRVDGHIAVGIAHFARLGAIIAILAPYL